MEEKLEELKKENRNLKENYRNKKTKSSDIFPEEAVHLKLSRAIRCPTYCTPASFSPLDCGEIVDSFLRGNCDNNITH